MNDNIKRLKELVDRSNRIVFFGGAGVSTESGIPDFRSTDGLYNQEWKYPPEVILSHTFYESNPKEFFRFYRAKMLCPDVQPNAAHKKLAEWEQQGKLSAIEIWVDKETGVNYIFFQSGNAGGMSVLVDAEGKPVINPIKEL